MNILSGFARGALHEIYAAPADATAGFGFALAAAADAATGRPVLWVSSDLCRGETGAPYAAGFVEYGLDSAAFTFALARNDVEGLKAGLEGLRCAGLGAVLVELWSEARAFDLTASRRLALAARKSNITVLALRFAVAATSTAAYSRWRIRPAPSGVLAAQAPGAPAFNVALERHRSVMAGQTFLVEWDRELRIFRTHASNAALSRPMAPISGSRAPLINRAVHASAG